MILRSIKEHTQHKYLSIIPGYAFIDIRPRIFGRIPVSAQAAKPGSCQAFVALSDPVKALRQPHAHFAGWAAWSGRRPEAGGGRSGGLGRALESLWHCGPNAAFARSSSNLWQQVWEADGCLG